MSRVVRVLLTAAVIAMGASQPASAQGGNGGDGAGGGEIVDGPARFQVLSPTLIRLEYADDRKFEDSPTLTVPARPGGAPKFTTDVKDGVRVIKTSAIVLHYTLGSGPFTSSNLSLLIKGEKGSKHPEFPAGSRTPGNLGGWYRSLDNKAGEVELHDGILSRRGWYVLDDTTSPLLGGAAGFSPRPAHTGAYQDGYLFAYGTRYGTALGDFRELTGPAPLLPEKAFGMWFSRYQGYSEDDYRRLLARFRAKKIPLDVLVVDTDWKAPHNWNGWQWTPAYFPDPKRFVDWAHSKGLEVILNVHPSISTDDPSYPATNQAAGGLVDAGGRCAFFVQEEGVKCGGWDWARPAHIASYFALHAPFEAIGVDSWWLDWCCDDSRVSAPGLTPDTWINSLYADREREQGDRWLPLSRIGGTFLDSSQAMNGVWAEHRNTIHFTGDTFDTWEMLEFQAKMTAAEGAGIGMPYVSHDIASFHGDKLDARMYVRWMQLGAFQPILRPHSDHAPRLPFEYGGRAGNIAADFIRLRESLVPYIYTAARQAYDTGVPITRPMYLGSPKSSAAYRFDSQYMFGSQLLFSTVAGAGDPASQRIWFPPGKWTSVFSGKTYAGPAKRTVPIPLDQAALFARAGAIVPRQRDVDHIGAGAPSPLLVDVYTGGGNSFTLYEDSGDGLEYRDGQFARTPMRWSEGAKRKRFTVAPVNGSYPGMRTKRRYVVSIHGIGEPQRLFVGEGARRHRLRGWRYNEKKRTVIAPLGSVKASRGTALEVQLGK